MSTSSEKKYEIIIIGGSYSGLAAAMSLGRSLRKTLVIDNGSPCNKQTPHSHNFLTHDGKTPAEISAQAREQVKKYSSVNFLEATAVKGRRLENGFVIETDSGELYYSSKLIFATGVKDMMLSIPGFSECWGISVLHCPYCHGYEVRNEATGIISNGEHAFDFSRFLFNWTKDLTLFTNGKHGLNSEQLEKLKARNVKVVEDEIASLEHNNGYLQSVVFKNGTKTFLKALYSHCPFEQKSFIPRDLGCEFTEEGFLKVDAFQKTSIEGVYACGDNTTRLRTVSGAVYQGAMAGMMLNREMSINEF